ncbi:uncharacterized protein LOC100273471 [Zea mays]|uniref:RRM domain-containing protein n=1 Tax=Zea mays TaxID=4577 RepID=B4FVR6_MAIZE|nr:uncharacterized protein LOC100273471 [Zea mays]ACF86209.1 unknown [Zea mays]|eukprot:NP_001141380.1 uncharacterized protein LOC100273471 [Zea mays]
MAGYGEENQNAMNGYEEEEEEEEVEEVEEVYEEEEEGDGEGEGDEGAAAEAAAMAAETRSVDGGRGLAEAVGNVDAGGEDERDADSSGGDASGVLEDEHVIDGRTVEVKRTVPKELSSKDGPKTKKIFVGGIPPSLTEDKLKEHFSSYGKVVEHQIMLDHSTGRSRGFGFVTFESEDAVERVMSEGRMHDLGGKQVEIKKAEPKKPGAGDSSSNGRHSRGGGHRDSYRGSGVSVNSGGGYGYGGGYRSAAAAYYGSTAYGAYGRGYGYGATSGYGSGYGSAYGGSMYGGPYGAYGSYGGAYGGGAYGAPGGYGGGGYGSYGGAGGMGGGGSAGGRGSSRYHPYGK